MKKTKIIGGLVFCLLLFTCFSVLLVNKQTKAEGSWYDNSWDKRVLLKIDKNYIGSELYNFPVLVNINNSNIYNDVQSDLDDLVFIDYYNNETKLNHEIDEYVIDSGIVKAKIWVNIPVVHQNSDTYFWMYFGNPDCGKQENIEGTWNADFIGVYHLKELNGLQYDSTSYNNDFIANSVTGQGTANGMIGKCDDFERDSGNDYLINSNIGTYDSYTWEGWAKWESLVNYQELVANAGPAIQNYASGAMWIRGGITPPAGTLVVGTWYYCAETGDGAYTQFYMDKILKGTGNNDVDLYGQIIIGTDAGYNYDYDGLVDEIRISKNVRSWSWVNATYSTVKQDGFIIWGDIEENEETTVDLVLNDNKFTNEGIAGETTYPVETGEFKIVYGSHQIEYIRINCSDYMGITASNISMQFSTDNNIWGSDYLDLNDGNNIILLNSTIYENAFYCYGENPFPIESTLNVYWKLKIKIPFGFESGVYSKLDYKWDAGYYD